MEMSFPYGLPGVTPKPSAEASATVTSSSERWETQRKLEDRFLKALATMK